MDVRDIMSEEVKACHMDATLGEIAQIMWSDNIGSVPIVDPGGKPVGIITDRDIAMSAYLNHRSLWDLKAHEVIKGRKLWTCSITDPVSKAITLMKEHEIRRLPVVDKNGQLKGLLSMGDMVSMAESGTARTKGEKGELSFNSLIPAIKACFAHHALTHA